MSLPSRPRRQHWNSKPLYESIVGLLIQAQWQQGNKAAALRACEKYQAKLEEDMGLAPSEAIQRVIDEGS